MAGGINGPKRSQERSRDVEIHPQISRDDIAIRQIGQTVPETQFGFCPMCGVETLLYRCTQDEILQRFKAENMPSELKDAIERSMVCSLCEVATSPNARAFAVFRGYIWYLIGKPDSCSQGTINRTLWKAARQSLSRFREGERTRLRTHLAQVPEERGFHIASEQFLSGEDLSLVMDRLYSIFQADTMIAAANTDRQAIIGTIGMHYLLEAAESKKLMPRWLGNHRYFLTVKGLERIHRGEPLSHDPLPGETINNQC